MRILYVDDSTYDRDLIRHILEAEPGSFCITEAATQEEFLAHLQERTYDAVLTDFDILGFNGFEVLDIVRSKDPDLPVIIVTGSGSEEVAVEAMRRKASDYVIKNPQHLQRLPHTIRAAIERQRLQQKHRQTEAKLKARLRQQAVAVELGHRALAGVPLDTLLQEACLLVAQTLGLEMSLVLEARPDGATYFLRAGVGWEAGRVGRTTLHLRADADACFPVTSPAPVILVNLEAYPDRAVPALLREHGVISGMSVVIPAPGSPYGFLGAYTRHRESFDPDDLHFLQAIANVLATAIERHRAEEHLRASETRYRTLIESARDVIYTISREGIITSLNPAFELHTGFAVGDWVGRPFIKLVHPEDVPRAVDVFERILRGERPEPYELRIRKRSGDYLIAELTTQPNIEHGAILGTFGIARDITERKQAEAELIAAKERAEEMNRLKTAFLTNISHEIRTPLTSIIGFASILMSEVGEEHREFVEMIEQSGQRLLTTLNSILDLSMLESGTLRLQPQPVNVTEEVAEKITYYQPIAERKGLQLTFSSEPPEIVARLDQACLDRILNHLISNAIKFTERGSVNVHLQAREDQLEIRVADTGVGIDASFLPHLFDAFKQESMGIDRPFEGSGLGLAITHKLVTMMQGTIHVESSKGRGSTFTVTLPLLPDGAPERPAPDTSREQPVARRPRVLALEDNPDMHVLMKRFLGEAYALTTVEDEETALRLAREQTFDVVLMDINLGRARTGVEVLEALRQVPGYEHVPVIAVTAYALSGDRQHFLEAGFNGYLSKPFNRVVLKQAIEQVLSTGGTTAPPTA